MGLRKRLDAAFASGWDQAYEAPHIPMNSGTWQGRDERYMRWAFAAGHRAAIQATTWAESSSHAAGTAREWQGEGGADARTVRTPCRDCEDVR